MLFLGDLHHVLPELLPIFLDQVIENGLPFQQLIGGAFVHLFAVVENEDSVVVNYGVQSMGDGDYSGVLEAFLQEFLDLLIGFRVDV